MDNNAKRKFERNYIVSRDVIERMSIKDIVKKINKAIEMIKQQETYKKTKSFSKASSDLTENLMKLYSQDDALFGSGMYNRFKEFFNKYVENPDFFIEEYIRTRSEKKSELDESLSQILELIATVIEKENKMPFEEVCKSKPKAEVHRQITKYLNFLLAHTYKTLGRPSSINELISIINKIKECGGLDENVQIHNQRMETAGLRPFCVDEGSELLDKDNRVFGTDLSDYSEIQLEAMKVFYINRLEKIRESLMEGTFLLSLLLDQNNEIEIEDVYIEESYRREKGAKKVEYVVVIKEKGGKIKKVNIDEEKIKQKFMQYFLVNKLFAEITMEEIEKIMERSKNKEELLINIFYDVAFKKYEEMLRENFEYDEEFMSVIKYFISMGGMIQRTNYSIKDNCLKNLVYQAKENKFNWGIIIEDDSDLYRRRMLLGFDIPGLCMPIRLHCQRDTLLDIAKYVEEPDIPLYIGDSDFKDFGSNIGTQVLFQINPTQRSFLKKTFRGKKEESTLYELIRHLSYMQEPNPIKRLTDGVQEHPDYFNVQTEVKTMAKRREKRPEKKSK